ncbi:LysM peptidoglycan-binding domain-containing protein [Anoxynatronum buryatiense]|uniref:LysM domain-containing protein n=1 Tax=Anoxynatronum buryatiense TaxID=489973 RepID=A0AA45WWM1_9CLOT|nr:LysM peptidoglycan-binding domain-containing protein [Anoxynatronum buryatiense]SMP60004.1 LysM domain-containing protein [Anoxynatronum buryatiense]
MNRDILINNQYQVEEVLHQDAFQRIYLAQDLFSESKTPVYVTAFRDLEAGEPVMEAFQHFDREMKQFFDDFFLVEDVFYTVSKQCPGKPFPSFVTNTILNPYEKGQIVSNYLNKLLVMEPLPLVVRYVLSSFGNISVVDRKIVCLNNILFFSPEDLTASWPSYLQRIGDFLLCVYGNSLYARLDEVQEGSHPEVAGIIQRCYLGEYPDVQAVQKDFNPIFFKTRLSQDHRPPSPIEPRSTRTRTASNNEEGDIIMMPDHPDAPERPFLLTRERRVGRRSKRARRRQTLLVALAALLILFLGIMGINRLLNREPGDEVAETPPGMETPEVPASDPTDQEAPGGDEPEEPGETPVTEDPGEDSPSNETTPPATPPPTSTEPHTNYTVQSGDTLYAISLRFYGDGSRYPEIMSYNNITDASSLRAGQVLRIPNN